MSGSICLGPCIVSGLEIQLTQFQLIILLEWNEVHIVFQLFTKYCTC